MRIIALTILILAQWLAAQETGGGCVLDIGSPADTPYVGEGMHGREGPYPPDRFGTFFAQPFRWTDNSFVLSIPTVPGKDNVVAVHMRMQGGKEQRLIVEAAGRPIAVLKQGDADPTHFEFVVPAAVVGKQTRLPVTFRAGTPRQPTAGAREARVLFCAVAKVTITPREPEKTAAEPASGISVMPIEDGLYLSNGKLALWLGQPPGCIASVYVGAGRCGVLRSCVVQFERKGIGYKATGIGRACAGKTKRVSLDSKEAHHAVVTVTMVRTDSLETERCFEATYRIEMSKDRPCFDIRLAEIKNTDTVAYDVRGYYHNLQPPAHAAFKPLVFPSVAAWIMKGATVGAVAAKDGDFVMGFRVDANGEGQGEITRKLDASLKPGGTWKGDEPRVIIFATTKQKPEDIFSEALKLRP